MAKVVRTLIVLVIALAIALVVYLLIHPGIGLRFCWAIAAAPLGDLGQEDRKQIRIAAVICGLHPGR